MYTRPPSNLIRKAKESRIYVLADPLDPLWGGRKDINNRAFRPNAPRACGDGTFDLPPVLLSPGSLIYLPRYPADYTGKKTAYRALEVMHYWSDAERGVSVRILRVDQLFFVLPPTAAEQIEAGTYHEYDILRVLERPT